MTTSWHQSSRSSATASRALWSISVTVILASITHAYEFGTAALVVGAIVIAILSVLSRHLRTGNRPAFLLYGLYALLSLWVVVGFGLVGGLWNHAVKVAVSAVNGGVLPPSLERFFMSPDLGSVAYETIGILTFGASMFAAYFGYRNVRAGRRMARVDSQGQGALRSAPGAGV